METAATLALATVIAFVVSYWMMGPASSIAERFGMVDRPRRGEVQSYILPRTGGYAIFAAFLVATVISLAPTWLASIGQVIPFDPLFRDISEYPRLAGLLIGAILIIPLAVLDDRHRLGPLPQFAGQAVIASVPISLGVRIDSIANPFGGVVTLPEVIVLPLSLLWFIGMLNTLNFIDTMDGVAGGITIVAGIILAIRSIQLEQYSIAVLVLALIGATAGFLPFNLYPSRLIMGTCGSMFLGYALAALAIIGGAKIATTTMVLALPILDTGLVILQRLWRRRSPFQGGDAAHLPHRLLALGFSQRTVAYMMYSVCLALGLLSLALSALQKFYTLIGALLILIAIVYGLFQAGVIRRQAPDPALNPGQSAGPEPPPRT